MPRTLKLNGKPFKVELGPSLIHFYEGAVIGCQSFPWADFYKMVRLVLIGDKRVLCVDLGFRPEGFPFPVRISANLKTGKGRIWFEDDQSQEIRDFEIEKTSLENRTAIELARTRRLRAGRGVALPPNRVVEETTESLDSITGPAVREPASGKPLWGINDEGATIRIYTPDGDFTVKNSAGYRQIVWLFRHAAGGKTYDIAQLYSETQGRAEHTAALPEFTTEDSDGGERDTGDVPAAGTLNVDAQMDAQAKREVNERLHELNRERGQAQARNNGAALARIDKEVDDLKRYLTTGCSIKGKTRVFSTDLSKRVAAVKKAIERAIKDVGKLRVNREAQGLFMREAKLIEIGTTCAYRPSVGTAWVDMRK
jgi:hypothetical protein